MASMAWRLETCWRAGRVLKGDESALDGAGRQEWCTWVLESTALVREGEWLVHEDWQDPEGTRGHKY